jgi:tRNA(Ile)-lysidine synthase
MWSKVDTYTKKYNLLNTNDLYLIALSGGADSVALLLWMQEAGYRIHAANCNFHLRGEESDRDEAFCRELCQRLDIPLHLAHFDTHEYAALHQVSIEMAARELRYRWFGQLCRDVKAVAVCVAHHRDDSVETVLMNLLRGTGLRGLTGIQPKSELEDHGGEGGKLMVLRPLLGVSRAEVEEFLAKRNQNYMTDSTNLEADVLRNRLRLQVLPLLAELNPAVKENIIRTTENLSAAQALLDSVMERCKDSSELVLNTLGEGASREYIVFEWLKHYGFNGSQARQILDAETGRVFSSSTGFDVLKDRYRLLVEPTGEPMKPVKIPEEGTYILDEHTKISVRRVPAYVSKSSETATIDAQKVKFPLVVRRVENGDWMIPFGMKGRKLLSDLMTDRKMNVFEKHRQLVVVDAQGVIVWVAGLRTDQRVAVSEATREVVEVTLCAF